MDLRVFIMTEGLSASTLAEKSNETQQVSLLKEEIQKTIKLLVHADLQGYLDQIVCRLKLCD